MKALYRSLFVLPLFCLAAASQAPVYFSVPGPDAPELARRGSFPVGVRTLDVVHPNQVDILKFDKTGKYLLQWGSPGTAPEQIGIPHALAMDKEGVAYDIAGHRDAPAGLRIWGGPTVEAGDIALMLPWIEWAHAIVEAEQVTATQAAE